MAEVNRLEWDAYIRDSELMKSVQRIERRIGGMVDQVGQKGRDMENVFANMSRAATAFFTISSAQQFIQQLVRVRSEFQQLEIAFTTMLGSKEKADRLTQDLVQFASTTPFGMKDTANAAKQLLAYGSSASSVKDELRMLGDVASGVSQPIGELVYLYGTLRTQGRAYAVDIRQFAGRGIPIYKELAKVLEINESQVNSFVESGKVGFAEVQKAFQNMTAAGSMFGGLMEAQSKTIQGELERLGDAYDLMLNKIGKSTEGIISQTIQGASYLVENYETVLNILGALIVTYGAYRASLIATAALHQLNAARVVGLTTVELLHLGAIQAKTVAMRALNAVMVASPVMAMTVTITALTAAIYALSQVTDATSAAQQKLAEVHEVGASKADQERRSLEQLVGVLKDNVSTAEQKKAAYDKLQQQTGGILSAFSQEEIAIGKATATLDQYILKIREAASLRKAFEEFNALSDQMDELNRKGIEGVGMWDRLGRSLKNTFASTSQGIGTRDWIKSLFSSDFANKQIVDQEKEVLQISMDALKKEYGDKWNELITGVKQDQPGKKLGIVLEKDFSNFAQVLKSVANKGELDALKKQTQEAMESLAPSDSRINDYKNKLAQIAKIEEQYSTRDKSSQSSKIANKAFQESERLISINADVEKAREDLKTKFLSQDEQEIESAKNKYKVLRDEIRKFNSDPRNKVKIDGAVVDEIEREDIDLIREKQKKANKLKVYQDDLENYNRYLDIKKNSGEKDADQLVGQYKVAFQKLQTEWASLAFKKANFGLTDNEDFLFAGLDEMMKTHNQTLISDKQNAFLEALQMAETFGEAEVRIRKKYNDALLALGEKVTDDQKKTLIEKSAEEVSAIAASNVKKQVNWERSFSTLQYLSRKATDKYLDDVQKRLDEELKAGKLTRTEHDHLSDEVNGAKSQNNLAKSWIASKTALDSYRESVKKYGKDSIEAKRSQSQMFGALTSDLASASSLLGDLNGLLGSFGASAGLQETIGQIGALTDGLAGIASGIASGNPIAIISGSIKALTSVIDLFNTKDKKIQKQIEKYKDQLESIKKGYERIQKRIDNSVGESFYADSEAAINSLKNQQRALEQIKAAEQSKKKSDKQKIKEYSNQIDQLGDDIIEVEQRVREMRLQTDIYQLSTSVADALVSAFEAGSSAIEATDKVFEKFIKNALTNSAKLKFIQPIVEEMLKDLDNYMEANNNNLNGWNADIWKEKLGQGSKLVENFLETLYSGLGLSKTGSDNSSLSSGSTISRSITEQTGSELVGLFRASYDINKQQLIAIQTGQKITSDLLVVAKNKAAILNQIQINTQNTANEALRIANNTSEGLNYLRNIERSLGGANL